MATREKRLAQFNSEGEPPANEPVQVLCEDHSGTYQLPFTCRFTDGAWRNHESGGILGATVVGWRPQRAPDSRVLAFGAVPKCNEPEPAS